MFFAHARPTSNEVWDKSADELIYLIWCMKNQLTNSSYKMCSNCASEYKKIHQDQTYATRNKLDALLLQGKAMILFSEAQFWNILDFQIQLG